MIFGNNSKNLAKDLGKTGTHYLILLTERSYNQIGQVIKDSFAEGETKVSFECFQGECSRKEIDRIKAIALEKGCGAIVGLGGGKAIDTAKAVAAGLAVPAIVVPTVASNDAPCSGLSVCYNEEGVVVKDLWKKKSRLCHC